MTAEARVVPALQRLRAQLDELEWLLEKSGFDPEAWDAELEAEDDEGDLLLSLALTPKSNREPITLSCSGTNPSSEDSIGRRHRYYIQGNHHYDRFAVSSLKHELERTVGCAADE